MIPETSFARFNSSRRRTGYKHQGLSTHGTMVPAKALRPPFPDGLVGWFRLCLVDWLDD